MTVASSLTHDIRTVTGVTPAGSGLEIKFKDGSTALLESSHPNFALCRMTAESPAGRSRPLGVVLDAARKIVDLDAAHERTVSFIREDPDDPTRLMVGFWGYGPICYLTRDHPEYERIYTLLGTVVETDEKVWVAIHSQMVQDTQGEEEGESWWKILDVRPA